MPHNKVEIIELKIQLDTTTQTNVVLSSAAKTKLDELVNEQKVITKAIIAKKQKDTEEIDNIKRVFSILKESFVRSREDKCQPSPISTEKLKELYGKDISTNSLLAKLKSYIAKHYDNNLVITKHTKNGKSAYALAQYGNLDF